MKQTVILIPFILLFFLSACQGDKYKESQLPNIVYILADDMGYGDVSALNENAKIETPHIDALAEEGMIFTDAHSGSAYAYFTYGPFSGQERHQRIRRFRADFSENF